ncbi:uncharacterized protein LOC143901952 [Temnothorax americanus]|uniref:uncharacterized protein LOC143901952 n=1 Tax=Temnothorax americanus TaxID=1964332 RepID=UPI004068B926
MIFENACNSLESRLDNCILIIFRKTNEDGRQPAATKRLLINVSQVERTARDLFVKHEDVDVSGTTEHLLVEAELEELSLTPLLGWSSSVMSLRAHTFIRVEKPRGNGSTRTKSYIMRESLYYKRIMREERN